MPTSLGLRLSRIWVYLVALLAYVALFRLGHSQEMSDTVIGWAWPAAGLAVWLVMQFGRQMLWVVALGEILGNWPAYASANGAVVWAVLTMMAAGKVLAAFIGSRAGTFARQRWPEQDTEFSEPISFIAAALLTATIAATSGVWASSLAGIVSKSGLLDTWVSWWTSDVIGVLFVLPLLLALSALARRGWRWGWVRDGMRAAILALLLATVCWLVFKKQGEGEFLFVFFPLLVLATGWFGALGVRAMAFMVAIVGVFAASRGHGPFITGDLREDLLSVQLFLAAIASVALLLPPIHTRINLLRRGPWVLLLGGWALCALLFTQAQRQQARGQGVEFTMLTAHAQEDIQERLTTYEEALRSGAGLVSASKTVEREEWRVFSKMMDLPKRYPGTAGIGLIYRVPLAETEKFLQRMRADGVPDFVIHPVNKGDVPLPGYDQYVLTYIEPATAFRAIIGLDIATESVRRETAERAADKGVPQLTSRIVMSPDGKAKIPGFSLYLPVYKRGAPLTTVAERREAVQAWIFAPFATERFLTGVLGPASEKLGLYLFEDGLVDEAHLLFASAPLAGRSLPPFEQVTSLELAGRRFTLGWTRGPSFSSYYPSPLIWLSVGFTVVVVLLTGWLLNLHTSRERAEATIALRTLALRESEASYRALFEYAPDGIVVTSDDDTRCFEDVNASLCRMLGYTREELLQKRPADIVVSMEVARVVSEIELIKTKAAYSNQWRFLRKDGSTLLAEVIASVMPNGRMMAMIRDITERKRTEAALRASDQRFRDLVDSTDGIVWEADAVTWEFISVSKNAERMLGYPITDWLQSGFWISHLHPEDREHSIEYCASCTGRLEDHDFEYRFIARDGRVVWLRDIVKVVAEEGRPRWLRGLMVDITARKLAETERQMFERKLQDTQKLESLGVLAGGIAHDFNNILTGILGNAGIASLDLPKGSSVQANLESIKQGTLRAADLCRQMLAYSGKGRFVVNNLSINQLVEESTHLLELSISKKSVLRFNLHKELPPIEADATQIRQVIMNLVINASEAIGEKSGVINLSTGLTRVDKAYLGGTLFAPELADGTYVYLEVADTGCGMNAETQAKIFDPFFTTKFTGRGLGLAAVLGIVRGHRGALKIYSELGRGTTFKLLFPCAKGQVESLATHLDAKMPWRGTGCILVVDDEESVRTTAALILRKMGFDVALAADGREAVDAFRAEPDKFTLVLMDLTMPHQDGEQAFAELRRIRRDVKVVLMSGFNEQEAISRFTGKGLASFLQKPFQVAALSETIQRVLEPTAPAATVPPQAS